MKLIVPHRTTLFEFVRLSFPEISASKAKKIILYGSFSYCGGVVKSPEIILPAKAVVEYEKYVGGRDMKEERTPLPILFEDEFLLVVLKPAGLELDARPNSKKPSLFSLMKNYVRRKSHGNASPFLVHRMATGDAGLCVLAKNKRIKELLQASWGKDCLLHFRALIHAHLPERNDVLTFWLTQSNKQKPQQLPANAPNSMRTQTEYKVWNKTPDYSEVDLIPHQDHPQQLHFCMERMGTPIIGDNIYGDKLNIHHIQKLFGYKLHLKHPATARRFILEMSLPETFQDLSLYSLKSETKEKKDDTPLQ